MKFLGPDALQGSGGFAQRYLGWPRGSPVCVFYLSLLLSSAVNLPQDPLMYDATLSLKQSGMREEAKLRLLMQFLLTHAHTSWTIKATQEHSYLHCTLYSAKAFYLSLLLLIASSDIAVSFSPLSIVASSLSQRRTASTHRSNSASPAVLYSIYTRLRSPFTRSIFSRVCFYPHV